jgi:hypothetical protein
MIGQLSSHGFSLWLDPIPHCLQSEAVEALESRDPLEFLSKADNEYGLDLIKRNRHALRSLGIYESALLAAFTQTRTNNRRWSLASLRRLFQSADIKRLRAAGDQMPSGPFTIYRGVAGRGAAARIAGLSWTGSLECACWFAMRYAEHLPFPRVLRTVVTKRSVLAYINEMGRDEQEYIVLLPSTAKLERIPSENLVGRAQEWTREIKDQMVGHVTLNAAKDSNCAPAHYAT